MKRNKKKLKSLQYPSVNHAIYNCTSCLRLLPFIKFINKHVFSSLLILFKAQYFSLFHFTRYTKF